MDSIPFQYKKETHMFLFRLQFNFFIILILLSKSNKKYNDRLDILQTLTEKYFKFYNIIKFQALRIRLIFHISLYSVRIYFLMLRLKLYHRNRAENSSFLFFSLSLSLAESFFSLLQSSDSCVLTSNLMNVLSILNL